MALLHSLEIKNFRGIKEFHHQFFPNKFICLVGRGDSGKTTILDAISYVLSSNWNITLYDSDFYNCDIKNPIEILATLIDLPETLLKGKYGFQIRGFNLETRFIEDEISEKSEPAITIRLFIDKELEPSWTLINGRNEPIPITANARAKLNSFLISDYTDNHFSWGKGRPLYSLLKLELDHETAEEKNIILEALREAKTKIDENSFEDFRNVIEKVVKASKDFGIKLSDANTTIDFRDISIKDNRVCLHDAQIPFRQKGKGSKRLLSMSIQSLIAAAGGIVLVDEVEQGLEPDRIKNLIRSLQKKRRGQIFMTTHSQNVIEELEASNIYLAKNESGVCSLTVCNEEFQSIVRACPEAMYAKKVIVCEGKTELGICRAVDEYRISLGLPSFSENGIVYTLGEGNNFPKRAELLVRLNKKACVFCDSDKDGELAPTKEELKAIDIKIFDCEEGLAIEQQLFNDMNWNGIQNIIKYLLPDMSFERITQSVESKFEGNLPDDWLNQDDEKIRKALGLASKSNKNGWFKRIDHGEVIGNIFYQNIEELAGTRLFSILENISKWVDNE
ncbi:ATP-dependent nuclease [Sunxiuqinia dokdonensis]|uniref:Uncharacterized protein n=1 Tax=Sunxiuqinia dokdonensis TaxID=1409788 RepID=A0A0L8V4X1_9BACT|nr:ATP-binding protein [Sunxiuqinia dokdonensis]KOH43484.1 hypothetical protein NC99_36970 [Sunxiuqinia dokdonensis]